MNDIIHAAGWALIHFLWQGALLGLAAAALLWLMRGARPGARYAMAGAAMLACLLWHDVLDHWKRNVEDKLETLNDIHRFAVEQTGMAQGNLLELVIVLILIIEFGMLFS